MNFWIALVLLLFSTCGFVNGNCPPPSQIAPCTCKDAGNVGNCSQIYTSSAMEEVFKRNPHLHLSTLVIDKCTMEFLPKVIMEEARFEHLNITNSDFVTLFDAVPAKKNDVQMLFISNVKVMAGFDWRFFSFNTKMQYLIIYDVSIKIFDDSFRKNMAPGMMAIMLEKTRTFKITHQAFSSFNNTRVFYLKRSFLRKVSRDMFPKPWNTIVWLDLSFNRLKNLPEDMFNDMPYLQIVHLEKNGFTTVPQKPFNVMPKKIARAYYMEGNPLVCDCDIKWLTTTKHSGVIAKCVKPKEYAGKEISSLKPSDFSYCT